MQLELSSRRVFRVLTTFAVAVTLISLVVRTVNITVLHSKFHRPIKLVDVDEEASLPTWFSSVNLAVSAVLVAMVYLTLRRQGVTRFRKLWLLLAVGFLVLSLDESIAFHELTGAMVKKVIPAKGVLRFSWIAWGMVLVVMLGAAYLKFIFALPPRRRRQFIVAGGTFVFGAVLMEMLGGKLMDHYQTRDALPYLLETHVEEFVEMFAIVLFNTALVEHLGSLTGKDGLTLQFAGGESVNAQ